MNNMTTRIWAFSLLLLLPSVLSPLHLMKTSLRNKAGLKNIDLQNNTYKFQQFHIPKRNMFAALGSLFGGGSAAAGTAAAGTAAATTATAGTGALATAGAVATVTGIAIVNNVANTTVATTATTVAATTATTAATTTTSATVATTAPTIATTAVTTATVAKTATLAGNAAALTSATKATATTAAVTKAAVATTTATTTASTTAATTSTIGATAATSTTSATTATTATVAAATGGGIGGFFSAIFSTAAGPVIAATSALIESNNAERELREARQKDIENALAYAKEHPAPKYASADERKCALEAANKKKCDEMLWRENRRQMARNYQISNNNNSGNNNSGNDKDPKDNKGPGIGGAAGAAGVYEANKNKPASTPVGRSGDAPMNVTASNTSTVINDTKFTGHALDQMQSRGVLSPSAVIDTVKNPIHIAPGNTPGTSVFSNDSLTVVANKSGVIITVINKPTK